MLGEGDKKETSLLALVLHVYLRLYRYEMNDFLVAIEERRIHCYN